MVISRNQTYGPMSCLGFATAKFDHSIIGDTPEHLLEARSVTPEELARGIISDFIEKNQDSGLRLVSKPEDVDDSEDLVMFRVCTYSEDKVPDVLESVFKSYDYHLIRKHNDKYYWLYGSMPDTVKESDKPAWLDKYDSPVIYLAASNKLKFGEFLQKYMEAAV